MNRNILVISIICILLGTTIMPVVNTNNIHNSTSKTRDIIQISGNGNTLYVGGTGPNNYTRIQDAIDDANDGDTVFVYNDSSPYYENVVINKSIELVGENKNTTIIDGNGKKYVITVNVNEVIIEGFTIQNSSGVFAAGIFINHSNYNHISGNNIQNNRRGVLLLYSSKNTIANNSIRNNFMWGGIIISGSDYNIIDNNYVYNNPEEGIMIADLSDNNKVMRNKIFNNGIGIYIWSSRKNIIYHNDFVRNERHAIFNHWFVKTGNYTQYSLINFWIRNYWDNWPILGPKIILGCISLKIDNKIISGIPWFNFDLCPHLFPYE